MQTGHLVYGLNGTLLAQAFDLDQRTMRGEPVALVEGARSAELTGAAMFGVSENGSLVYVRGGSGQISLVWVDREGREDPLPLLEPGHLASLNHPNTAAIHGIEEADTGVRPYTLL